jgi:hypothetical protein
VNHQGPVIAWTGGCKPAKPSEISAAQASVQKYLFAEQVNTWFNYWHDYPNWDTLKIFFNRARYDAHATFRK